MLGIRLSGFLRETANDNNLALIQNVLNKNTQLRIVFVHPEANYISQRAIEDNVGRNGEPYIRDQLKESVKAV